MSRKKCYDLYTSKINLVPEETKDERESLFVLFRMIAEHKRTKSYTVRMIGRRFLVSRLDNLNDKHTIMNYKGKI